MSTIVNVYLNQTGVLNAISVVQSDQVLQLLIPILYQKNAMKNFSGI